MGSRSLAEDETWVRAHLWRDRRFSPPRVAAYRGHASWVECPGCRSRVRAFEVLDLRGTDAHPADGLCAGCIHRTHHDPESPWTEASLHQAAGMAWEHVRTMVARHIAHELEREHWSAENARPRAERRPFRPAEVRNAAHAAAGARRRDLVGEQHHHAEIAAQVREKMKGKVA